ncbi:RNA polymerase sigma factor [Microbacterium esteraromaticum]|uniref:RNA polymerase sigma factor n=1 Tax=Microbacterium esteraromaticum TaxID=57043 RepID=UPI0023674922|nr:RNA polymerase sigma factor [Microbacterium esteraromaticum]WDH77406.1 RNA polymerase sigma factor [Microbacterium esteraromaticum]
MRRRSRSTREAHLEHVYVANAADLLSYFGRRAQVPADAADLLSETFVVAWRRGDRMPVEPEQARMWLFGVARRVLANAARGAARQSDLTDKLRAHLEALPSEHVGAESLDIRTALDAIPDNQSELVRLVLWDGFTLPEAATIVGISESTARGRYQRARIQLRELLHEHQFEGNTP